MFAVDRVHELATNPTREQDPQLVRTRSAALFSQLKAANRAAHTATHQAKDVTALARQEMDQAQLGLQNLLYERRHLEREIEKCRQFASAYQDVPLHSVEQFTSLAPPESTTEEILHDEHQLMLNRLSFELAERQRLEARRKELTQAKESLLKQSRNKLVTLDGVRSQIENLMKTATDIQKKVDDLVTTLPPETTSNATAPVT